MSFAFGSKVGNAPRKVEVEKRRGLVKPHPKQGSDNVSVASDEKENVLECVVITSDDDFDKKIAQLLEWAVDQQQRTDELIAATTKWCQEK